MPKRKLETIKEEEDKKSETSHSSIQPLVKKPRKNENKDPYDKFKESYYECLSKRTSQMIT